MYSYTSFFLDTLKHLNTKSMLHIVEDDSFGILYRAIEERLKSVNIRALSFSETVAIITCQTCRSCVNANPGCVTARFRVAVLAVPREN